MGTPVVTRRPRPKNHQACQSLTLARYLTLRQQLLVVPLPCWILPPLPILVVLLCRSESRKSRCRRRERRCSFWFPVSVRTSWTDMPCTGEQPYPRPPSRN